MRRRKYGAASTRWHASLHSSAQPVNLTPSNISSGPIKLDDGNSYGSQPLPTVKKFRKRTRGRLAKRKKIEQVRSAAGRCWHPFWVLVPHANITERDFSGFCRQFTISKTEGGKEFVCFWAELGSNLAQPGLDWGAQEKSDWAPKQAWPDMPQFSKLDPICWS